MTASATPYAKDLWCPILRYRDCCFLLVISLMTILLMGVSATPILMKCLLGFIRVILIVGLPRIIWFSVKWFVENGVLVRQLRISVGRQFVNCSNFTTSFNRFISVDASSPTIQLLNWSASRNAKFEYVLLPNLFKVRNLIRWNSGTRSYASSNAALSVS